MHPKDRDAFLKDLEVGLKEAYKPKFTFSIVHWVKSLVSRASRSDVPIIMLTTPEAVSMKLNVNKVASTQYAQKLRSRALSGEMDRRDVLRALYELPKQRQVVHY